MIGKLDPNPGAVTEYKTPEADATDPHTLIFDQSGILWFTVQNANRVGRLDPKTSEIKLLTPPTPKARPYSGEGPVPRLRQRATNMKSVLGHGPAGPRLDRQDSVDCLDSVTGSAIVPSLTSGSP